MAESYWKATGEVAKKLIEIINRRATAITDAEAYLKTHGARTVGISGSSHVTMTAVFDDMPDAKVWKSKLWRDELPKGHYEVETLRGLAS